MQLKKTFIFVITISIWLLFGVSVLAEGETTTETKTWGDTILEYVPTLVEGIVAFGATIFALKLSTKKVSISLEDLGNAKDNFSNVSKLVKQLSNELATYNEEFARYNEKIKKIEQAQEKIMKALKTIATNNKELVKEGASIEVVKQLEGDEENEGREEINN